jgi:hypothetical protein
MTDFFDSMRRGLEKGVASVSVKSRELFETTELRRQLRALQDERKAKTEELGNILYVMLTRGTLDEGRLREKVAALVTIDSGIREREAQIRTIQQRAQEALAGPEKRVAGRCSCGSELPEGARFCGGCGAKVSEAAQLARSCAGCASPMPAGALFCGTCGAAVSSPTSAG